MHVSSIDLKMVMRNWTTGVAVVTSENNGYIHGMTVSSFTSVSVEPPIIVVTLAKRTRTHALVQDSGKLGITILAEEQTYLSDIFAGKVPEDGDRFAGVSTGKLLGDIPLLEGGLAWLIGDVIQTVDLPYSTVFLVEVKQTKIFGGQPLLYQDQAYWKLGK